MAEAEPKLVCIGASGAMHVEGLKSLKVMVSVCPLEACMALTTGHLDDLQLTVKHMCLCCDIEYLHITFIIAGDLGDQSPVTGLLGQFNGLMVGHQSSAKMTVPYVLL